MKCIIWSALFVSTCAGGAGAQQATPQAPRIVIGGPIVVAFFCTDTAPASGDEEQNYSEALSDFDYYLDGMEKRLLRAGIELKVVNARSFETIAGKSRRVFKTSKIGVGYYLFASGKAPHLERSVMTDEDLADVARKYFGVPIQ